MIGCSLFKVSIFLNNTKCLQIHISYIVYNNYIAIILLFLFDQMGGSDSEEELLMVGEEGDE